jgi:Ca-activated chloride channel family protein
MGVASYLAFKSRKTRSLLWAWIRRGVVILLFGLLLLRPGIGEMKQVDIYTNQYDVYFVVDTTASMVAEDWGVDGATRLDGVKQDIGRIVDQYSGARYSLITFDSVAITRTPLTKDATAVMSSTNLLAPEITKYSKGSSIGIASNLLASTLSRSMEAEPERARIVFFFSDGEQTSGGEPESYERSASYIDGGAVYGYGTVDGGPMKKQNGLFITSKEDDYIMDTTQTPTSVALSKIDEENMSGIATQLTLDYSTRSEDTPIVIPELLEEELSITSSTGMNVTSDFTWAIAIPLYALLSFELAYILLFLTRMSRNHKETEPSDE